MLESRMRQIVVRALKPLDAISVENSVRAGTPDVNCTQGWIELKVLPKWPVRERTKVSVPCYTPQQRVWARRRTSRGGKVFFLILIDKDWLLYRGYMAAIHIGDMDRKTMLSTAILHCHGTLDTLKLQGVLLNHDPKTFHND